MSIRSISPLAFAVLGIGLLAGCSPSVSQKDVNEERREAEKTVADAQQKTQEIRHEVRKEVAEIDQERRDKVAELRTELQTNKDANAPNIQAQIAETNRQADKDIAAVENKAGEKEVKLGKEVREETQEAKEIAAKYQSQEAQKQYVDDQQKALEKYDLSIADLKKNRDNLAGEARDRFDVQVKHLDDKRAKASKALDNLKGAKPEEWLTFRDEVQRAFAELHTSYQEAAGRGA